MIKPYTILTQMWLDQENDNLGLNGSFVDFRVNVDSIDAFWVESPEEIVLVIKGNAYYIENESHILHFLSEYFNPMRL
jgi:hypothetical protein